MVDGASKLVVDPLKPWLQPLPRRNQTFVQRVVVVSPFGCFPAQSQQQGLVRWLDPSGLGIGIGIGIEIAPARTVFDGIPDRDLTVLESSVVL